MVKLQYLEVYMPHFRQFFRNYTLKKVHLIYTYTYTYTYTYIHVYIHTCIHAYMVKLQYLEVYMPHFGQFFQNYTLKSVNFISNGGDELLRVCYYALLHLCMYVCMLVRMCVYMYISNSGDELLRVCYNALLHLSMYVCMLVRMCVYMYYICTSPMVATSSCEYATTRCCTSVCMYACQNVCIYVLYMYISNGSNELL